MQEQYQAIQKTLEQQFLNEVFEFNNNYDFFEFECNQNFNLKVLTFLYDNLQFQFLTDLTAVHYPEKKGKEILVVYHLHQLKNNLRLRLKVYLPIDSPKIFSATALFAGANWMERETFDFFGVIFIGHPNLKRILNVDELDYFPLRKEYPLEDNTRKDKDDEMFGRGKLS